ncbi:hypothetical protein [Conservatibacter flavescens]|uniref:hypothetical protein n=1 Tax=Conservatibacter flavescens TaxID=28161 RepID=UPI0013FDA193|nr:hypothetical protein [Conservatibacter flavescens]
MKKLTLAIMLGVLTLGGIAACNSTTSTSKQSANIQGQWLNIDRAGKPQIKGIYYPNITAKSQKSPLIINVHGGAFVKGSATDLDAQSRRIGERLFIIWITPWCRH